jgi:hypothetical protein
MPIRVIFVVAVLLLDFLTPSDTHRHRSDIVVSKLHIIGFYYYLSLVSQLLMLPSCYFPLVRKP